MANNRIAIAREQQIFVVPETTIGTLAKPAGTDLIIAAGNGVMNQQPDYADSPEIVNSRDVLAQFRKPMPPGDWNFPILARASGTPGLPPEGAALFKALFGQETVNAGSSVVYTQTMQKPSVSIWILKSHTMFFAWGATVGQGTVGLGDRDAIRWDFSGQFMGMGWVGTSEITQAVTAGDDIIHVREPKNYQSGGYCKLGDEDNGGAGYRVTGIDISAGTITISPSAQDDVAAGQYVEPWYPSGTVSGVPLEMCGSYVAINDIETPIQDVSINIGDQPKYLDDEVTSACRPISYVETTRDINGNVKIFFREKDAQFFYSGLQDVTEKLNFIVDHGTGRIMDLELGKVRLTMPNTENVEPTVALNMTFKALGDQGEDSAKLTWR